MQDNLLGNMYDRWLSAVAKLEAGLIGARWSGRIDLQRDRHGSLLVGMKPSRELHLAQGRATRPPKVRRV
jgi:hypothetical protein